MMKKLFNYALFGAIALAGASGFTACSSSDEIAAEVNPNYNAETKEVPVDFVFNVATSNEATTRMSSANTQAALSETFRGINNATLMTFSQSGDGKNLAAAATAAKSYDFGTVLGAGAIDPDGSGQTAPKSRRVLELSLPTETNTLMFWGKAIKTGTSNQQGSVTWSINKDLSKISFTADRRIPAGTGAGTEEAYLQYEALIGALLTKLVDTRADYSVSYGDPAVQYSIQNFGWKDYVTMEGTTLKRKTTQTWGGATHDLTPLGEIMADAFIALNTFYTGETRAGSGPAVATMLGDLYEVLQKCAGAEPTSGGEAISKAVAGSLQTQISTLIDTSSKKWKSNLAGIKAASGLTDAQTNLVTADLNNFPQITFNVPQGATVLKLDVENTNDDATRKFTYSYNQSIPSYAMNGSATSVFNPINYRYPVELCYFGNSPVRVSDTPHETNNYPDGVSEWDTDGSWSSDWSKNDHVKSTTRSVAMQQNINYGTALLKTTVRYGAGTLSDNNHAIQEARKQANEPDNTITAEAGTFTLTGVLVGGVEAEVGWNYLAKATSPTYSSFIYDNDLPSTAIPAYTTSGAKSTPNFTLVWDNWNQGAVGSKQNIVYVALEFVNNSGKDFWGMHNIIRNGQTFYITGKLDPDADLSTSDRSAGITWPGTETGTTGSPYALPPYNTDGTTIKERRIFIQDYMTTADFVIGANSLKSALIDVPDLRSSQISLGLSVDLQWQTGLNFGEVILGQ